MESNELAWMTGLFEGEGNIHLSTQYSLTVTITNNDVGLLEPFTVFGNSVKHRNKRSYVWRIGGNNQVRRFCEALLPYLKSVRQIERFRLALSFIKFDQLQVGTMMADRDMGVYSRYYKDMKALSSRSI